jgi:hypothetical protein
LRSQNPIDRSGIITVASQLDLHVHNDPIGCQVRVSVNGAIIPIICVWIPARIPVARVPVPPPVQNKDDARIVTSPPGAVMPLGTIIVKRGVPWVAKTIASPIVDDTGVPSKRKILTAVHRQVAARANSGVGWRSSSAAQSSCRRAIGSQSTCTSEISLAINRHSDGTTRVAVFFDQQRCWRTASNSTIATAVARFRLRVPCIGIVRQLSIFSANNFSGNPLVSLPKTRKSPLQNSTS